jgi:uncharacterized membrane protein
MNLRNATQVRNTMLLSGIVLLGTWLRLLHLGQKSYWWDEIVTLRIASMPFADFRSTLWRFEANMSFYYLLARWWIHFGNDEAWLRSLSVITAVVSIPVIYALGTVLSQRSTGLLAAFLLSINVAHIAYAQEARSYSLLVLLCLLSLLFFLRLSRADNANALGYVLASALAVYAHFFAVFFLVAQWTSLFWLPNKRHYWQRLLLPVSATAVLILPALYYMAVRRSGQLAFVPPLRVRELAQVFYVLTADAGRYRKAIALLYLFSCGIALRSLYSRWRRQDHSFENWRVLAVALCAALPIAITFLISFRVPVFFPRYLLICLPALVLLAAYGLTAVGTRWLSVGVCAVIALLSVSTLSWYYSLPKDDWRSLTAYISAHAQPGDVVVGCPPGAEWPVQYYRKAVLANAQPDLIYLTPDELIADVRNVGTTPARVWVVAWQDSPDSRRVPPAIAPRYRCVDDRHFSGALNLSLYERCGGSS